MNVDKMDVIECQSPTCTCTINSISLFSNKRSRYVGSLWAHAWFCRGCEEALYEELAEWNNSAEIDFGD